MIENDGETIATPAQSGSGADSAGTRRPADDRSAVACDDLDMRIARDGTWYYHGTPIGRKPLVKLFASVLRHEPDGCYYLVTPVEKGRIEVDDAPFIAVELFREHDGQEQALRFRTNLDEHVTADADHPIRVTFDPGTDEPAPYVLVRDGLEALIARSVYYDLVEFGVEVGPSHDRVFGVWSSGSFFALGRLEAVGS